MPSLEEDLKVNIESCQLRRDRREVLKNIQFSVHQGEKIGIIGESGAGKSTLFNAILGFLPDSQWQVNGAVTYHTSNLLDYTPQDWESIRGRHFRIMLQEPALTINPTFRIKHQLDLAFKTAQPQLSEAHRDQSIAELMDRLQLKPAAEIADKYPRELSGGQLQRISIGMAIGPPCRFLLVDEPTNSLDAIVSMELVQCLKRMYLDGHIKSIIFITHDLNVARALECDRILVMHNGRLVGDQSFKKFMEQTGAYVRNLMNTSAWLTNFGRKESKPGSVADQSPVIGTVRNLSFSYGRKGVISKKGPDVIKGISLKLRRGRFTGLIGNSGEGKSTLGLNLALLVDKTAGEIRVLDTKIKDLRKLEVNQRFRHQIQIITQQASTAFDPSQKIWDNFRECLTGRGIELESGMKRVKRLMKFFQLHEDHIYKYPHQLSSGEKQRLAIIRSLIGEVRILIADEPFIHLDAENRKRLVKLLLLLKNRPDNPLTCIIIAHDLNLIRGLCDTVAIIHKGKIIEENTPEKIYKSPQHQQTKKLVEAYEFLR